MSLQKPLLLPHHPHLLLNQQAQTHPLIAHKKLGLAVWMVSGKCCLQQKVQRELPSLIQVQGDNVHYQITIRPSQSRLTGVVLIRFRLEYRKIGCRRSALTAYHEYVSNKPVGQHLHVCALLKSCAKPTPTTTKI